MENLYRVHQLTTLRN